MMGAVYMEFEGIRLFPVLKLGLSQIYLNKSKLEAIEKWFCPEHMDGFEPLPVHDFGDGRYTLTDGHTRAYAAYQAGLTHVPVIYDKDDIVAGDVGKLLYRADIEWCDRFKLKNISHLCNRIVSQEQYEKLWIERCDRSYSLLVLAPKETRDPLYSKEPELYLYGMSEDLAIWYYENEAGELFFYKDGRLAREEI